MGRTAEERFQALICSDSFFEKGVVHYAMAPGRLDLMGGIADYSGSLVLQATINGATWVAAQPDKTDQITIRTTQSSPEIVSEVTVPVSVVQCTSPLDYPRVLDYFKRKPSWGWAAYLAGVISVLSAEKGIRPTGGMKLLVDATVPLAAGVSSSASLEVATMLAVSRLLNIEMDGLDIAILCQKVENYIAGAPCGIMDQIAVTLGRQGQLLKLKCNPHNVQGYTRLPEDLVILGIHSGVRHSVGGGDYGVTRTAAFMGLGLLQASRKAPATGYLSDMSPQDFRSVASELPIYMRGQEFLDRGIPYPDNATAVIPSITYHVRSATEHPVYENYRVNSFCRLLEGRQSESAFRNGGKLMYGSHWSYSVKAKLGSPQTDKLVSVIRRLGPENGFYGAKITGGGCGGTVAVLANKIHSDIEQSIIGPYQEATGCRAAVITCGGPGALELGVRSLVKES